MPGNQSSIVSKSKVSSKHRTKTQKKKASTQIKTIPKKALAKKVTKGKAEAEAEAEAVAAAVTSTGKGGTNWCAPTQTQKALIFYV